MAANGNLKLHGKDASIYLGGRKGDPGAVRAASKTEWTLQRNRDYVDATVFGDTNKTYLAGLPNLQGTFAGFLDCSGDLLLAAAKSGQVHIALYADDGSNGGDAILIAQGSGYIDGSVNATNTDAIRFTGEFRASQAWDILV